MRLHESGEPVQQLGVVAAKCFLMLADAFLAGVREGAGAIGKWEGPLAVDAPEPALRTRFSRSRPAGGVLGPLLWFRSKPGLLGDGLFVVRPSLSAADCLAQALAASPEVALPTRRRNDVGGRAALHAVVEPLLERTLPWARKSAGPIRDHRAGTVLAHGGSNQQDEF